MTNKYKIHWICNTWPTGCRPKRVIKCWVIQGVGGRSRVWEKNVQWVHILYRRAWVRLWISLENSGTFPRPCQCNSDRYSKDKVCAKRPSGGSGKLKKVESVGLGLAHIISILSYKTHLTTGEAGECWPCVHIGEKMGSIVRLSAITCKQVVVI